MIAPSYSSLRIPHSVLSNNQLTPSTSTAVDLVTETDQAVEKLISTSLAEKYPTFSFMGEETYKPGDKLTDAPTFILGTYVQ